MRQLKISQQYTQRETQSLEMYFTEVARLEMITPEEEVQLTKRIKAGDGQALQKMVKANLRFVISVAKQYQNQGMPLSDLINEGNCGLIKAAQRFDETRGFKFISYAVWWIRQSIIQAIADQARIVRLPVNRVGSLSKISKASAALEQVYEREPTVEELSEIMSLSREEIEDNLSYRTRKVSIDAPVTDDAERTLLDTLGNEDEVTPDSALIMGSLKTEIRDALSTLSQRESLVLSMFYGLGGNEAASLDEIGDRFNLSRERVRQIKEKATRKLQSGSRSHMLRQYIS